MGKIIQFPIKNIEEEIDEDYFENMTQEEIREERKKINKEFRAWLDNAIKEDIYTKEEIEDFEMYYNRCIKTD